jgi:uncharacterized membrane protein YoaK (UPF0700 family)
VTPRWRARWPWAAAEWGPLPLFLIGLTFLTGIVDGVSFVGLGHVFVANMTGNVVFLGFALAGTGGLSAAASLIALGAFVLGAVAGGQIGSRCAEHRARHLRNAIGAALPLLLAAVLVAALAGRHPTAGARYAIVGMLALAMGIQNATARRLAVPDLTTTVLTLTLTGIGADSTPGGGGGSHLGRRLIAVTTMFAGALVSALLALRVDLVLPLALAATVAAAVTVAAHGSASTDAAWTQPPPAG